MAPQQNILFLYKNSTLEIKLYLEVHIYKVSFFFNLKLIMKNFKSNKKSANIKQTPKWGAPEFRFPI